MRLSDHLTCPLRNLYAGQEATVRNRYGTDWFQIGKGVHQCYTWSPCLFNFYAEYIMRNAGLEEAQTGIKIVGRNINKLRYADYTIAETLYGRKWKGTKEPLDESKRREWKSWLKIQNSKNEEHGIWSHHFMTNRLGKKCNQWELFCWATRSMQMVTAAMKLKDDCSLEGNLWPN